MEKLKSSKIRAYQEYRLGQVSKKGPIQPATVNRETALLSSAINYARREWDWDIPNPVVGRLLQEPEGRVRHLSLSEVAMLIRLAQAHTPHLADFIELGVQTGCRKQELLGLEWDRVDFDNNRFYLEGQHTKSGKRRSVPLNDRARLVLERRRFFVSNTVRHPVGSFPMSTGIASKMSNAHFVLFVIRLVSKTFAFTIYATLVRLLRFRKVFHLRRFVTY